MAKTGFRKASTIPVGGDPQVHALLVTGSTSALSSAVAGDVASAATDSGNPVKIGGKAESTVPTAVTDGQRVDAWFGLLGALATLDVGTAWATSIGVSGALVATTDNTTTAVTDAPTSTQKIVVDDVLVSVDAACNILFEIETTGTDLFRMHFAGAGFYQFTPRGKLKLATADKKLTSKASTTVNAFITVLYHSEA